MTEPGRPSHSPWSISRKPGSGRTGTVADSGPGPACPKAATIASAVSVARPSGQWATTDGARRGIGRLADRFGLGPRPAQTVYEYAGTLSEAVPTVRAELATVARAKVEVAYGRQTLGPDRLHAVSDAYRRLRFAIVRRGVGRWLRRGR